MNSESKKLDYIPYEISFQDSKGYNKNYHRKVELGLREQKILDLEQCYTVTHTTHT